MCHNKDVMFMFKDELKLVKSSILSSYASSTDNAFNIANLEASRILKHRPFDSFERDIHTINTTTVGDLYALAQQHLQGNAFYTVVATDCASSDLPVLPAKKDMSNYWKIEIFSRNLQKK